MYKCSKLCSKVKIVKVVFILVNCFKKAFCEALIPNYYSDTLN